MGADPDNFLIFKLREKQQAPQQVSETQTAQPQPEQKAQLQQIVQQKPAPQPAATQAQGQAATAPIQNEKYPDPRQYYELGRENKELTQFNEVYTQFRNVNGKAQSRDLAKKTFCVWHPWRRAYAVCAYCHRPFCFEDTMEYKNNYYCSEDIDKVSAKHLERIASEYSITSILTAMIMLVTFLAFLYYTQTQIISLVQELQQMGIKEVVFNFSPAHLILIGGIVIMTLNLIGAIYVFTGSRRSHILSAAISIVAVSFFSYQYINTATTYLGIIAGLSFLAFLCGVYSASTGVQVYNPATYNQDQEFNLQYWPNSGRF